MSKLTDKEKDVLDRVMRHCCRSKFVNTFTHQDTRAFNRIHDKLVTETYGL